MKSNKNIRIAPIQFVLLITMVSIMGQGLHAQTISGPTSINQGTTNTYTLSGSQSNVNWNVSSGATILSSNNYSASIKSTGPSNFTVSASFSGVPGYTALFVNVTGATPATPGNPTVVTNGCGEATLQRSGSPPGGVTWYWQGKDSNGTSITKGYGSTFVADDGPGTYYIRAKEGIQWSTGLGSVSVTINYFSAGSIGGTQTICYNGNPGTLTNSSSASGSDSGYTYQWQYSNNGTSGWTNISGATSTTYNPPGGLTASRWYRRRVIACGETKYTGWVKVTVRPTLVAGSINNPQTICYNGNPSTLGNSSSASGGDGSYSYQWQYSNNGTSGWTNISGATSTTYNPPGGLTASRWYRRKVGSCSEAKTTSNVKVTVVPVPSTPVIASTVNNCGNTVLTMGSAPGGETWYWQTSTSGTATAAANSNSTITLSSTQTGTLTHYLRAKSSSASCWGTALAINYTVNQGSTWYADTDGDGFGEPGTGQQSCSRPSGRVENDDDQCVGNAGTSFGCTTPPDYSIVTKSDENYVYTRNYQKAMDNDGGITGSSDVIEEISYFDGLGRAQQHIAIKASGKEVLPLNLQANIPEWSMDWTAGSGSTPFFNQNGATTENLRINGANPHGEIALLWECGNDVDNNADGGWNTDYFNVDKNVAYRYTVWVKRTSVLNGWTYHGTQNVNNLDGSANSNPYFWYTLLPQLDQWYLMVGIVHPTGYSGGDTGVSGVYDLQGNKVLDGTEFTWRADTTTSRFRSYLFYSTNVGARQYFYAPVVQKIDGTENALTDIIDGSIGQGPGLQDIVTHIEYDAYGRSDKEWLPYRETTGNAGSYRGDVASETQQYYQTNYGTDFTGMILADINAYSEKALETSPLNRLLKQAAPGKDWKMGNGHEIGFDYTANAANEVRKFKVTLSFADNTYPPTLVQNGYFTAGELYKTVTQDENHSSGTDHTTEEFKDKQGRVVLKRTYASIGAPAVSTAHDTYYVYDDYGNLSYVIPPKVTTDNVSTTELDQLCYQYVYDHRNRLVEKKIPGKGWEYIVYNKLDQPIMTQDANLNALDQWLFTLYDAFGRVAYTGLDDNNTKSRETIQAEADAASKQFVSRTGSNTYVGTEVYYSKDAYPDSFDQVHTINYYDDYAPFVLDVELSIPTTVQGQTTVSGNELKGLATGSKVRVLGTTNWITTLTGYDTRRRPVYTASKNSYLSTTDFVETQLDFAGKVLKTKTIHTKGSNAPIVTEDYFTYDPSGRLLTQNQLLNGEIQTLLQNNYDGVGHLVRKDIGGKTSENPPTIIDRVNISVAGSTISNTSSIDGWNYSGFATAESINNKGFIEWQVEGTGTAIWIGLSYDNPDQRYTSIDYALYRRTNDVIRIYENGTLIGDFGTYSQGDVLRVQRTGEVIEYIKNNSVLYTSTVAAIGPLQADACFYTAGGTITDFRFIRDIKEAAETPLQSVDYDYNVRGWLTGINDSNTSDNDLSLSGNDLFGFKINYNDPKDFGSGHNPDALFNGNIAQTLWKTGSANPNPPNNPVSERYSYTYDALNRITTATDNTGNYNLYDVTYDRNGNIATLKRKGNTNTGATTFGTMDNLVYTYKSVGNQLKRVKDYTTVDQGFNDGIDTTEEYTYDANGNMVQDLNKGIQAGGITYNHLNLPVEVKFDNNNLKKITYIYDAVGTKLKKTVNDNGSLTNTEYAGNFVYEGGNLQFFNHPEGYVEPNGSGGYDYVYQYKDHLGNIRLSYQDINDDGIMDGSEITQERNYYPFGLEHNGYNSNINGVENNYMTYNGKEHEKSLDLNWHDFGARNYDAALGRWMNIDPLAEKYMDITPYNYVANSPNIYIDETGEDFAIYFEQDNDGNWQIRITATYYVRKGDKDSRNSADAAIKIWNNKKGYSLRITDENNDKSQIGIVFDLKVSEVDDPQAEKEKDVKGNDDAKTKDGSSNVYSVVPENEIKSKSSFARGLTTGLYNILVPDNAVGVKEGAHEIGHTLGLDDKGSGVMGGGNDISIREWDVQDIIEFAEKAKKAFPNINKVSVHGNIPKGKRRNKVKPTTSTLRKYHE